MTETESPGPGIKGVVLVNSSGECVATFAAGSDPAVSGMVSNRRWLEEAASRRLVPVLLNDARYLALVTAVEHGYLILLSEASTDTVLNFVLSVEFAYDIIDHVLTDPYDAMTIVDAEEKLAFVSPVHEKFFGLDPGEAIGRNVQDVIENTRLHHVLRTGVAEVGQIQRMRDADRVVSRHPIRHKGAIVGAIGRVMFKGPQRLEAMARRINALEQTIARYKARENVRSESEKFLDDIVGRSAAIQSVKDQIRKIAPLDIPVLIQGESGTGKELAARALHMLSPRNAARLVTVNAAALPDSLVEAELFGYESGSFTGADRKGRMGKFELADKGTIFLDEISEMPAEVQVKLLRVLQDRMLERIGSVKPKRVDFRLICASNADLEALVEQGRFRMDLFYRVSPVVIAMPTLEERLEDIPLLLNKFVNDLAREHDSPTPEIHRDVAAYLTEQPWPGNVRQLRNVVERAMIFAKPGELTVEDFQGNMKYGAHEIADDRAGFREAASTTGNLKDAVEILENRLVHDAMVRFNGNKKQAAEYLGISRSYLYKKLGETTEQPVDQNLRGK